jgi:GMP synthase (glutamine-hydrolysing)
MNQPTRPSTDTPLPDTPDSAFTPAPTRRCLALQHVSFEDLGTLGDVLAEQGFDIVYRQAGVDALSGPQAQAEWAQADLVVVLGGPIGVYEADRYPFIHDELARVRERLASGRPLIGICLGAQMMAAASGQRVYPGPAKEIGYKPLLLSPAGQQSPLAALATCGHQVLHWHGDTFDLPEGAELLASTDVVAHQIYSLGPKVLGLQCHLEARPSDLERWLIGHTAELTAAGISLDALRADNARHGEALVQAAREVWRQWLAGAL